MSNELDSMILSGEPTYCRLRIYDSNGDYVRTLTVPQMSPWPILLQWKERLFVRLPTDRGAVPIYREAKPWRTDDDGEHLQSEL